MKLFYIILDLFIFLAMSGALVMSRAELERIKQSVATNDNRSHNERKAALKRLSEDRVKHWPNTLEALRKKKESFLKDKELNRRLHSCSFKRFQITRY